MGAGSEDSNLSASNPNVSDSGSPVTRPGSVELMNNSQSIVNEDQSASPESEPKAKRKSRFDQPEDQTSMKECPSKEEKKPGKKNDWDMFADSDNFGTAVNVSVGHWLKSGVIPLLLLCLITLKK